MNHHLTILFSCFLLCFTITSTYGQTAWAKNFGGSDLDQGTDIIRDDFGNIYTTGFFEGTVDFDPSVGVLNLSSVGQRDFFIAKYDNLGNLIWAKSIGGGNNDHGRSILLDASGNIFVAGDFDGLVDFDPGMGFSFQDTKGASDIFLAKYDSQGDFIWAKTFGGNGIESCRDVTMDATGNLLITGVFQGTADFDPNGGVANIASSGSFDAFMVKLDGTGNYLWAKSIQSTNSNYINQIVVNHIGEINVIGYFQGTADFDPSSGTFSLTTIGNKSIFFGKYTSQGALIDMKMIGGSGFEVGKAIAIDMQNNIYITGDFRGVVDFDPSGNTGFLTSSGLRDICVAKYTADGNFLWADKIGGQGEDQASAITVDNNNEVFVAGYFNHTMMLSNNQTLTSAGNTDIILSRYSKDGTLQYAVSHGGANGDETISVVSNNNNHEVFSIGWIQGASNFEGTILNSAGDRDIYIARTIIDLNSTTAQTFVNENDIRIFPNPSNGNFTISIEDFEAEQLTVSVIDVTGRVVATRNWTTHGQTFYQGSFSISNIRTKGLYFVKIASANQVITKKIIIQ